VSPDVEVALFHSNVSLTCPGCEGTVSWFSGQVPFSKRPYKMVKEGKLLLHSVRYTDEKVYTCFKGEQTICSVNLLVSEDLEKPLIHCYLRYPASNIICEWKKETKFRRGTSVTLISRKGFRGEPKTILCSYISSAKKYQCRLHHREDYSDQYILSMCVTSKTESKMSDIIQRNVHSLLQPDPPINVTITPIEAAPRKLRVDWHKPSSWLGNFYTLNYEVQYWVENSQHTSNGTTTKTYFYIEDALRGRKHFVLVRAREEYNGNFSSWSKEAEGTPWAEETFKEMAVPSGAPWYTFVVAGTSLGLIVLLLLAVLI
ncbi:hypothetical protein GDO86_020463, partial [Hymenochirus boettgeri]